MASAELGSLGKNQIENIGIAADLLRRLMWQLQCLQINNSRLALAIATAGGDRRKPPPLADRGIGRAPDRIFRNACISPRKYLPTHGSAARSGHSPGVQRDADSKFGLFDRRCF
jgi:hypothetical protein